jgi:hypothetical protein
VVQVSCCANAIAVADASINMIVAPKRYQIRTRRLWEMSCIVVFSLVRPAVRRPIALTVKLDTPLGHSSGQTAPPSIVAMTRLIQSGSFAGLLLACSTVAICQSSLPPTAPTSRELEQHSAATVIYNDGRIAVLADNSSLQEILRDVARRTGMTVKGSVIDEPVFGTYGPAAPAQVISNLLEGTETNMILVAGKSRAPELILTPRHGGPSPPQQRAVKAEENDQDREAPRPAISSEISVDSEFSTFDKAAQDATTTPSSDAVEAKNISEPSSAAEESSSSPLDASSSSEKVSRSQSFGLEH